MIEAEDQLIMNPADFDKRLATDQTLRNSIGGFSCISLYHVRKGWHKWGYSIPIFGSDGNSYCDLLPDVYERLFGEKPNLVNLVYDLDETMRNNRECYGKWGAVMDFLLRQRRTPDSKTSFSRSFLIDEEVIDYFSNIIDRTDEELAILLDNHYDRFKKPIEIIARMFPSYEDLEQAIMTARKKRGVQIVYGGKDELVRFLQVNDARPVDSCAAEFAAKVPARLVRAIIPLGEYEQQALLGY